MKNVNVLITGDYWHQDFRMILQQASCSVTLVPANSLKWTEPFFEKYPQMDLIVIAIAHRDQFQVGDIETLATLNAPTPVVCLLGSWCEGSARSGNPPAGVPLVYWHQWQGRFDRFTKAVDTGMVAMWSLPPTANDRDRVLADSASLEHENSNSESSPNAASKRIAVSALTAQSFDMVSDAVKCFQWKSEWFEMIEWEAREHQRADMVCVDADSWSPECEARIRQIRKTLGDLPIVLLLNYPRVEELESVSDWGIETVVSKPFLLGDLKASIEHATSNALRES